MIKRLLSTMLVTLMVTGCAEGTYLQATYASNKSYIGMPISEFREVTGKKASLEAMEAGYTVYRVSDYAFLY